MLRTWNAENINQMGSPQRGLGGGPKARKALGDAGAKVRKAKQGYVIHRYRWWFENSCVLSGALLLSVCAVSCSCVCIGITHSSAGHHHSRVLRTAMRKQQQYQNKIQQNVMYYGTAVSIQT